MSIGGLSNVNRTNPNANQSGQGGAGGSEGQEFSLEKQQAGAAQAAQLKNLKNTSKQRSTTEIVDKKKRNHKGAPRTIIVDGDIYEVFLLAIA